MRISVLQGGEYVKSTLPAQKVFLLRYEDLCQDPKYWLQCLYNFLDVEMLEPPDTVIPKEHHIIGNKIRLEPLLTVRLDERWKTTLTEEEISLALRIAGEMNERFGYT